MLVRKSFSAMRKIQNRERWSGELAVGRQGAVLSETAKVGFGASHFAKTGSS